MTVTTTYLELRSAADLRPPSRSPRLVYAIRPAHDAALNRALYEEIGADHAWVDRLNWSDERWARWADQVETWVVRVGGEPAGYTELRLADRSVLIAILGLRRQFQGAGLGAQLLTHALRRGLELGDRVWVSTNTRDGPHALPNYLARGMKVFRTATSG